MLPALLVAGLPACGTGSHPLSASPDPPASTQAMTAAPSPPATSSAPQPPMQQAGHIVPGTTVMLPRSALAGSTVTGRAPPGSTITFDGHDHTVPESGKFELQMPDRAGQSLPVRVQRPGRTAMTLLITLQARHP